MPFDTPPAALFSFAVGNFPLGADSWSATPRRDATGQEAWAADALTPNLRTDAQFFAEFLARAQEWVVHLNAGVGLANFGDASDGDVVIAAGTTTLARDMYYDDLTVEASGVLDTAGYRVWVSGTLLVEATGVVSNDGGAASGGTAGTGAGTSAGPMIGGSTGGAGVTNTLGDNGLPGTAVASNGIGGTGGAGGDTAGQTGGAGGVVTAPTVLIGGWRHQNAALGSAHDGTLWRAGSGGGSGATEDGTGTSGGGGGGGGLVAIFARVLDNAGTIRADGGVGGDAVVGTSTDISGGAGGGGGFVYLIAREIVALGTVQAAGGAGGAGAGAGVTGAAGGAGEFIVWS